jgi:hypothetical protein
MEKCPIGPARSVSATDPTPQPAEMTREICGKSDKPTETGVGGGGNGTAVEPSLLLKLLILFYLTMVICPFESHVMQMRLRSQSHIFIYRHHRDPVFVKDDIIYRYYSRNLRPDSAANLNRTASDWHVFREFQLQKMDQISSTKTEPFHGLRQYRVRVADPRRFERMEENGHTASPPADDLGTTVKVL